MNKIIKRILSLFAVAALIYAGCRLLTYMLQDDTASKTRLMMHEFYNQDNIDYLFVGTSHFVYGIDPILISEKTGKKAFSASNPAQMPDASLALIKEAVGLYKIKEIFLEMNYFVVSQCSPFKERTELVSTYSVSDYLRFSGNKISFLLNASSGSHYVNSFWPGRRYWEKITDLNYIDETLQKKSTSKYKNYTSYYANNEMGKMAEYKGKGFSAYYTRVKDHQFLFREPSSPIGLEYVSSDCVNIYEKIIDFCKNNQIKLTLLSTPAGNPLLQYVKKYDEFTPFVHDLIESKDIKFIDMNLLPNDYYPYVQTNYMDGLHQNGNGAEQISNFIADYINGSVPDDVFLNTVSEKLKASPSDYYGIFYYDDYDKKEREFSLISNNPDYFEYKIEFKPGFSDYRLIQDYSVNNVFSVPFDWIPDCEFKVSFRRTGTLAEGEEIRYVDMEPVY